SANTGTITARGITVTAETDSKVYDGAANSVTVPAIIAGTVASVDTAAFTQSFNNKNVGTGKTLTLAGSVNVGNGGANYSITLASVSTGVITSRAITATAVADSKAYDGTATSGGVPTLTTGTLDSGDTA